MELNLQQLKETVREWMLELVGETPPAPAPEEPKGAAASGGDRTTEVRVSPSGDVVIRVVSGGGTSEYGFPQAPGCYDRPLTLLRKSSDCACYGPALPDFLAGLCFSPAEEALFARILQATGLSREALLLRLVERLIAAEAVRYAQDIGLEKPSSFVPD
jgi:hypothetical protein